MQQVHAPLITNRALLLARLSKEKTYDIAIIGGGATGLGIALDAALRGFKVVLVVRTTLPKEHRLAPPSWCMVVSGI